MDPLLVETARAVSVENGFGFFGVGSLILWGNARAAACVQSHPIVRKSGGFRNASTVPMSDLLSHDAEQFDPEPLLWWVLVLLGTALVLEVYIAVHWTEPFTEVGNWVLIGVFVGFALRLIGRRLRASDRRGEQLLRWASVVVWALSAGGGLFAWLL